MGHALGATLALACPSLHTLVFKDRGDFYARRNVVIGLVRALGESALSSSLRKLDIEGMFGIKRKDDDVPAAIGGLQGLEHLWLTFSGGNHDIAPLSKCTSLKSLALSDLRIASSCMGLQSVLSACKQLRELSLPAVYHVIASDSLEALHVDIECNLNTIVVFLRGSLPRLRLLSIKNMVLHPSVGEENIDIVHMFLDAIDWDTLDVQTETISVSGYDLLDPNTEKLSHLSAFPQFTSSVRRILLSGSCLLGQDEQGGTMMSYLSSVFPCVAGMTWKNCTFDENTFGSAFRAFPALRRIDIFSAEDVRGLLLCMMRTIPVLLSRANSLGHPSDQKAIFVRVSSGFVASGVERSFIADMLKAMEDAFQGSCVEVTFVCDNWID